MDHHVALKGCPRFRRVQLVARAQRYLFQRCRQPEPNHPILQFQQGQSHAGSADGDRRRRSSTPVQEKCNYATQHKDVKDRIWPEPWLTMKQETVDEWLALCP